MRRRSNTAANCRGALAICFFHHGPQGDGTSVALWPAFFDKVRLLARSVYIYIFNWFAVMLSCLWRVFVGSTCQARALLPSLLVVLVHEAISADESQVSGEKMVQEKHAPKRHAWKQSKPEDGLPDLTKPCAKDSVVNGMAWVGSRRMRAKGDVSCHRPLNLAWLLQMLGQVLHAKPAPGFHGTWSIRRECRAEDAGGLCGWHVPLSHGQVSSGRRQNSGWKGHRL